MDSKLVEFGKEMADLVDDNDSDFNELMVIELEDVEAYVLELTLVE